MSERDDVYESDDDLDPWREATDNRCRDRCQAPRCSKQQNLVAYHTVLYYLPVAGQLFYSRQLPPCMLEVQIQRTSAGSFASWYVDASPYP